MQSKTTRAFRTISEAGEELDLQPHVLRFWESKFTQIKPIKRGGGRRFYRPEDIEFLRGIKILLHDEGHPIKDVQKLIRLKGATRVMELGQSVQKASRDRKVEETVLVPERIQKSKPPKVDKEADTPPQTYQASSNTASGDVVANESSPVSDFVTSEVEPAVVEPVIVEATDTVPEPTAEVLQQRQDLEEALERLHALKQRWTNFTPKST